MTRALKNQEHYAKRRVIGHRITHLQFPSPTEQSATPWNLQITKHSPVRGSGTGLCKCLISYFCYRQKRTDAVAKD